jgi:hypothetical protein
MFPTSVLLEVAAEDYAVEVASESLIDSIVHMNPPPTVAQTSVSGYWLVELCGVLESQVTLACEWEEYDGESLIQPGSCISIGRSAQVWHHTP